MKKLFLLLLMLCMLLAACRASAETPEPSTAPSLTEAAPAETATAGERGVRAGGRSVRIGGIQPVVVRDDGDVAAGDFHGFGFQPFKGLCDAD